MSVEHSFLTATSWVISFQDLHKEGRGNDGFLDKIGQLECKQLHADTLLILIKSLDSLPI